MQFNRKVFGNRARFPAGRPISGGSRLEPSEQQFHSVCHTWILLNPAADRIAANNPSCHDECGQRHHRPQANACLRTMFQINRHSPSGHSSLFIVVVANVLRGNDDIQRPPADRQAAAPSLTTEIRNRPAALYAGAMSDGTLREVHPNIWRGTLDGWTVELFYSSQRWHLAIILPNAFTQRCQPV
jgi:hypothetical protein